MKTQRLVVELYLLPFCELLIEQYLKKDSLEKEQLESIVDRFIQDLNQGIKIILQVGLDGLMIAEDITLKPNDSEEILIRKPRLEDYSKPIMAIENWDGDYDNKGNISIPTVSSIIELEFKKVRFVETGNFLIDPRIYDSNRTVDLLVNGALPKAYELFNMLTLFQSTASPHFQSINFSLILRNLVDDGGKYEVNIRTNPTSVTNRPQFILTKEHEDKLKVFWTRMSKAGLQDRLYGSIEEYARTIQHIAKPTEIAFNRYLKILDSWEDYEVRIHETIETLEGYFAPEKHTTKDFIRKVVDFIELLSLDADETKEILRQGYRIRSDYTHHGPGWAKEELTVDSKSPVDEMRIIRHSLEQRRRTNVAKLTLNYLRISIVARVLSGISDVEFVEMLKTEKAKKTEINSQGYRLFCKRNPT